MKELFGVSLWILFTAVVPGLVTIAAVCGAFTIVEPQFGEVLVDCLPDNGWIWASFAVSVMVLTQFFGIRLEHWLVEAKVLVDRNSLHDDSTKDSPLIEVIVPKWLPQTEKRRPFDPYVAYNSLDLVLASRSGAPADRHIDASLFSSFSLSTQWFHLPPESSLRFGWRFATKTTAPSFARCSTRRFYASVSTCLFGYRDTVSCGWQES